MRYTLNNPLNRLDYFPNIGLYSQYHTQPNETEAEYAEHFAAFRRTETGATPLAP